jgi:ankyrin repeat protein
MSQEIFEAIRLNDRVRVEQLVSLNPTCAHARNEAGVSALMQARYEGRQEIVNLLRAAAGELDVFEAATLGDVLRLRLLLAGDPALVRAFSNDGFTGLHLAVFFGQAETAEELLRHGADPNAVARNPMRVAVINSAAASGRADLVKIVLQAGADPNVRQTAGYTALHAAAARDNIEMVQLLLDAGADASVRSDDGQTAADKAGALVAELLREATRTSMTR